METETTYGVRNCLDRDKFVKSFGEEKFEKLTQTDKRFSRYREPPIPLGCNWIWEHFLDIWYNAERDFNGNVIFTPQTINEYEKCFGTKFSFVEKKLMFKMKMWINETIADLNK